MTSHAWEGLIGWSYLLPHRDSLSPSRTEAQPCFLGSWVVAGVRSSLELPKERREKVLFKPYQILSVGLLGGIYQAPPTSQLPAGAR